MLVHLFWREQGDAISKKSKQTIVHFHGKDKTNNNKQRRSKTKDQGDQGCLEEFKDDGEGLTRGTGGGGE